MSLPQIFSNKSNLSKVLGGVTFRRFITLPRDHCVNIVEQGNFHVALKLSQTKGGEAGSLMSESTLICSKKNWNVYAGHEIDSTSSYQR